MNAKNYVNAPKYSSCIAELKFNSWRNTYGDNFQTFLNLLDCFVVLLHQSADPSERQNKIKSKLKEREAFELFLFSINFSKFLQPRTPKTSVCIFSIIFSINFLTC